MLEQITGEVVTTDKWHKSKPIHMKPKLGSGERFAAIENKAAKSYEKKGMSPEHAKEVGAAIAAKIGQKKHGIKRMSMLAAMAKKK
jgi:hypothetical protein